MSLCAKFSKLRITFELHCYCLNDQHIWIMQREFRSLVENCSGWRNSNGIIHTLQTRSYSHFGVSRLLNRIEIWKWNNACSCWECTIWIDTMAKMWDKWGLLALCNLAFSSKWYSPIFVQWCHSFCNPLQHVIVKSGDKMLWNTTIFNNSTEISNR